jgi:hypothetical protein
LTANPAGYSYRVRVLGDAHALDVISKRLPTPIKLLKEGDEYWLEAPSIDAEASPGEAQAAASKLVTYIRGAMRIAHVRSSSPVEVNAVRVYDSSGKGVSHHVFAGTAGAMGMIGGTPATVTGQASPLPPGTIPIDKALTDRSVADALEYLARDESWYELYKAFEVVRGDVGGEAAIDGLGWATDTEMERFRRSADNAAVSGYEARHADRGLNPPKNPMTLADASVFISRLVEAWLATK